MRDIPANQRNAIQDARDSGEYLRAQVMERMFRGQWVEEQLSLEFTNLRWNHTGVDAVDPVTGLQYEILTGTERNCTLVVKVPRKALVLNQVHMRNCTIEVARVLKHFRWAAVHLKEGTLLAMGSRRTRLPP